MPVKGRGFLMKIFWTAALVYAVWSMPAHAMFCSEPSEPYCVNSFGAFTDGYDFEDCKRDVESYADDVNDYVECLRDEQQAAIDAYNDAVNAFNRRARGY
jgi:hypothetical protein